MVDGARNTFVQKTRTRIAAETGNTKPAGADNLPTVCELINATWDGHELLHPLSAEAPRVCCAVWDPSDNAALHVRWVAPGLRLLRALSPLFDHINNFAIDRGISMVFFMCEKESEMPTVLQNVFRTDGDIRLYTRSLAPGVALSGEGGLLRFELVQSCPGFRKPLRAALSPAADSCATTTKAAPSPAGCCR